MIKTYSKVFLTIVLLTPYLYPQDITKPVFETVWQKIYGGEKDDKANGIVMLENGDSAIIGECKSYGAKRSDICVTRINSNGQTKWRKLIDGEKEDRGMAISRAKDGNLLILGSGKSFNKNGDRDLYVAKLSLDGKILWQRTFGGDRDEFAGGIAGTDDGGALIVGDSESFSRRGYKDIFIIRLDKDGKKISEQTIGGKKAEEAKALTRTADGNFMMVGSREVARAGDSDFFLLKLDQDGKKIWARTLGEENHDVLNAVAPTPDGGIVATGSTRSFGSEQTDLSVMYFDKTGKLIWHKIYGYKYYDEGNAITMTKGGGFMIAGSTNSMGKGDYDTYVIALDKKGSLIWSQLFGERGRDMAHAITRTTDGKIIIVGESDSYRKSEDFYMIKLSTP
ncbi:hypothetical protein MNB_SV-12-488 [hydrothermal vent metagenome]|uniref:Pyrrolo-quinoline quinone repeat domain-containing protein n=1 Tax=hydrothermal vent metagenome TaxID=652676 RepID=A0A1W1CNB1_9ZZZZ